MKKQQRNLFLTILTASVLTILSTTATAQARLVALSNKAAEAVPTVEMENVTDGAPNTTTVDERASQNFSKEFASVTNATWNKTSTGYVVRFYQDGIVNDAFLTKKGNCHTTVRYYAGEQLPAAVQRQVKHAYADFDITSVTEVHLNNQPTAYLVTISGLHTWKEIRVVDGMIDVRAEYMKN